MVVEASPSEEPTSLNEVDLWVLVPDTPQVSGRSVARGPVSLGPSVSPGLAEDIELSSGPLPVDAPLVVDPLPEERPSRGEAAVRRTGRVYAGQHSNRYLPWAVGEIERAGTGGFVSNSVSALFRPWN